MCVCVYVCGYVCIYVLRPTLHKFRPAEILVRARAHPRVPPCNDLKNDFKIIFLFYEANTSKIFYTNLFHKWLIDMTLIYSTIYRY